MNEAKEIGPCANRSPPKLSNKAYSTLFHDKGCGFTGKQERARLIDSGLCSFIFYSQDAEPRRSPLSPHDTEARRVVMARVEGLYYELCGLLHPHYSLTEAEFRRIFALADEVYAYLEAEEVQQEGGRA